VLHPNLNCVTFHPHVVGFDRLEGWQLGCGASAHVETRAVPRAFDLVTLELALVERAAVVRAQIVDGVELPTDIADGYLMIANLEDGDPLGWNV
jgi:hypothetical protein